MSSCESVERQVTASHHREKGADLRGLLFHLEYLVVKLVLLGREVTARERRHAVHRHHADRGFAESSPGMERLLDVREQIGRAALLVWVGHEVRLLACQLKMKESSLDLSLLSPEPGRFCTHPFVLECLSRCRPLRRVSREARRDEAAGGVRDVAPVLLGLEGVVARDNRLRFLLLRVAAEGSVSREEEVNDYAHCPDVDGLAVTSCKGIKWVLA